MPCSICGRKVYGDLPICQDCLHDIDKQKKFQEETEMVLDTFEILAGIENDNTQLTIESILKTASRVENRKKRSVNES